MGFLWDKWTEALGAISGAKEHVLQALQLAIDKGTPLEISVFARDLIARHHDSEEAVDFFFQEAERLYAMEGFEDHKRMALEMVMLPFSRHKKTGIPCFEEEIADIFKPRTVEFLNGYGQKYAQDSMSRAHFVTHLKDVLAVWPLESSPRLPNREFLLT